MGASIGAPGKKSGRRRRGVPRYGAMAEINMTPFIDVMLVLLIIFMVAAPLLATGVPIDLPQTKAGQLNINQKPITVAIDDKGLVYLMDEQIRLEELLPRLKAAAKNGADERVYVRGTRTAEYQRIAEVMAIIISGGFGKAALVTVDPPEQGHK